jgi:hypothetical protein
MHWTVQFLIAASMLGASIGMMFIEHTHNRTGRPFLKSEAIAMPYWLTYLILMVLGTTLMISAIIR